MGRQSATRDNPREFSAAGRYHPWRAEIISRFFVTQIVRCLLGDIFGATSPCLGLRIKRRRFGPEPIRT
jgi:hypothetical protein